MSEGRIEKTEEEWQETLSPEQYRVLREKGTEPPFTGAYYQSKEDGMYHCAACGEVLFASKDKYDSGTGWPSFTQAAGEENVTEERDMSLGMERTEVVCRRCGSHLGHVFDDGPTSLPDGMKATGRRYCINSVALDFKEE